MRSFRFPLPRHHQRAVTSLYAASLPRPSLRLALGTTFAASAIWYSTTLPRNQIKFDPPKQPSSQQTTTKSANMSSKLIPTSPDDVMVIRDITPNITTLSVPFSRFGIVRVGGRATIIRMTNGQLAIFSPVALTPSVRAKITQLSPGNEVGYIIAGDIEHHIFLSEWKTAFPSAKVIGPEGLPEKRSKVTDDEKITHIDFAAVLDDAHHDGRGVLDDEFLKDFEVEYVSSHANKEVVLYFKPDRVLIQADLWFNLPAIEQYSKATDDVKKAHGIMNRIFQTFQGTEGEAMGNRRFQWYVLSAADRNKYAGSVKRIHGWDFETVVPCHGETMVGDGKRVFEKVFKWHLEGK